MSREMNKRIFRSDTSQRPTLLVWKLLVLVTGTVKFITTGCSADILGTIGRPWGREYMWDECQKYLMKKSWLQENKWYHQSCSDSTLNFWLDLRHCLEHEQGCVSHYTAHQCLDDSEDPFLVLLFHCKLMLCLSI